MAEREIVVYQGLIHPTDYDSDPRHPDQAFHLPAARSVDLGHGAVSLALRTEAQAMHPHIVYLDKKKTKPVEIRPLRHGELANKNLFERFFLEDIENRGLGPDEYVILASRLAIRGALLDTRYQDLPFASPAGIRRLPKQNNDIAAARYITKFRRHRHPYRNGRPLTPLEVIDKSMPVNFVNLMMEQEITLRPPEGGQVISFKRKRGVRPIEVKYAPHKLLGRSPEGILITESESGEVMMPDWSKLPPNTLGIAHVEAASAMLLAPNLTAQDRARVVFMNRTSRDEQNNALPVCARFAYFHPQTQDDIRHGARV